MAWRIRETKHGASVKWKSEQHCSVLGISISSLCRTLVMNLVEVVGPSDVQLKLFILEANVRSYFDALCQAAKPSSAHICIIDHDSPVFKLLRPIINC
jgi:hypothetical protein